MEPLADGSLCITGIDEDFNPRLQDRCVKHWYTTGALAMLNAIVGDLTAILCLIEFVRPDKLIVRYIIAPHAQTQAEMNEMYALDSNFYLPFRYQLVLKIVLITFTFSPALPLLLPFAALFMCLSYYIDRYNLLRVFKPPPRTTDRTVTMSVLYILPIAVFSHVWTVLFFYSRQAGLEVPLLYYLILLALAVFVLVRISAELKTQARRPIKEDLCAEGEGEGYSGAQAPNGCGGISLLRDHVDAIGEMYVPPLTSTLLLSLYKEKAAAVVRPAGGGTSAGEV